MARNLFDHEFLLPKEAAQILRCSPRTLTRYRAEGTGPCYHKHGGRILYPLTSLREWVAANTVDPVGV
ncbi:helix-turn-helix domain-containing protein [Qipengyuania sp. 6B39]|nr:helix-turn-helix domain-containing protein [Qipengyuania proteolytica]